MKKTTQLDYKIVRSHDPAHLTQQVQLRILDGWETVGSHQVVATLQEYVRAGMEIKRIQYTLEYTQTMIKCKYP